MFDNWCTLMFALENDKGLRSVKKLPTSFVQLQCYDDEGVDITLFSDRNFDKELTETSILMYALPAPF